MNNRRGRSSPLVGSAPPVYRTYTMTSTASRQLALFADQASPPARDATVPARPALGAVPGFAQFVRLLSLDPARNRYHASAESAIRRLLRRRVRHGYRVVAWQ